MMILYSKINVSVNQIIMFTVGKQEYNVGSFTILKSSEHKSINTEHQTRTHGGWRGLFFPHCKMSSIISTFEKLVDEYLYHVNCVQSSSWTTAS